MSDKTLIQSYVFHDDMAFFVSTIDRNSSAMESGRYAETIVWEWNKETRQRGKQLYMDSFCEGSIKNHQAMCDELFATGNIHDPNEEQ